MFTVCIFIFMVVSSDLIRKYGFKSTVKDERVFYHLGSGNSRFQGWKFFVVWPGGVKSSSSKRE